MSDLDDLIETIKPSEFGFQNGLALAAKLYPSIGESTGALDARLLNFIESCNALISKASISDEEEKDYIRVYLAWVATSFVPTNDKLTDALQNAVKRVNRANEQILDAIQKKKKVSAREFKAKIFSATEFQKHIDEQLDGPTRPTSLAGGVAPSGGGPPAVHAGEPPGKNTISDFFVEVGKGFVSAQNNLDRLSAGYLKNDQSGIALPTLFRIPRVSAEIKFAMETEVGKGFNIFIASSTNTQREQNEQKVSFEIAAVPPPPELRDKSSLEKLFLAVYDPQKRAEIEKTIPSDASAKPFADNFNSTIILNSENGWILLLPSNDFKSVQWGQLTKEGKWASSGNSQDLPLLAIASSLASLKALS